MSKQKHKNTVRAGLFVLAIYVVLDICRLLLLGVQCDFTSGRIRYEFPEYSLKSSILLTDIVSVSYQKYAEQEFITDVLATRQINPAKVKKFNSSRIQKIEIRAGINRTKSSTGWERLDNITEVATILEKGDNIWFIFMYDDIQNTPDRTFTIK